MKQAPYTKSITERIALTIYKSITTNISYNIVSAPKVGKTLCTKYITENAYEIFPDDKKIIDKTCFLWLNLENTTTEAVNDLIDNINYYLPEIRNKAGWTGIEQGILELTRYKYKKVILVVDNAHLITQIHSETALKLYRLTRSLLDKLQFIFLSTAEPEDSGVIRKLLKDLYPMYTSNVVYIKLPKKDEFEIVTKQRAFESNLKLNNQNIQQIVELSGCLPGLMRVLLRQIANNVSLDLTTLNENIEVKNLCLKIWESFAEETLKRLKDNPEYTNDYLLHTGLKSTDGKWFSILFKNFVDKIQNDKVDFPTSHIVNMLTWQELQIYELLEQNKGKEVTREEIAEKLWQENWREKYSNWAIEQVISKIRKKVSYNKNIIIKTIPKVGFMMINPSPSSF